MKVRLRQYIRQLLKEDLGKYVWPDRASGNSRHYDGWRHPIYEDDTEREEELWNTFYQYGNVLQWSDNPKQ